MIAETLMAKGRKRRLSDGRCFGRFDSVSWARRIKCVPVDPSKMGHATTRMQEAHALLAADL